MRLHSQLQALALSDLQAASTATGTTSIDRSNGLTFLSLHPHSLQCAGHAADLLGTFVFLVAFRQDAANAETLMWRALTDRHT